jgi:uncharacterized Ntn-hydrolase superfamily protein
MKQLLFLTALILGSKLAAQSFYGNEPLAHTYSIVAIDEKTGDMGVAVQSHWFSTGTLVIWGEAGVGVVATQSFVNPAFGPEGLRLMKEGIHPETALKQMLASDEGRAVRQVALLNAKGEVAAHTGKQCIEAAGHLTGEGYSVQANLMEKESVWPAMAKAFEENKTLPLAERIIATLEAAQNEGGDIRGKQSAALLIVSAESSGQPWVDRKIDLRVDDHESPVQELKRLLKVHRAYEHMNKGDLAMEHGDAATAMKEYTAAENMFPDNVEMKFWHAVTLSNLGKIDEALPLFKKVFEQNQKWKTLVSRLPKSGVLIVEKDDLNRILSADE